MNKIRSLTQKQLFLPIFCVFLVLCSNIIYDIAQGNAFYNFFSISIKNGVLYGRIIDILNRGSEVAILAVALGGNSLGGGKFNLAGSIIGAYTIQAITTTLYALGVSTEVAPVFKAVVVIVIVAIQAPPVKAYFKKRRAVKAAAAEKEAVTA